MGFKVKRKNMEFLEQGNKTAPFPCNETPFKMMERGGSEQGDVVSFDVGLWSVDEIAAHLKRDRQEVVQDVVYLPSFPKAIRLLTVTGGKGHRLWKACEVKEWAEAF
jgi:hypothetical protein